MIVCGNMSTNVNETFAGNKIVTAYNLQERQNSHFQKGIFKSFDVSISLTKRVGWMSPIMYSICSVGIALVFWYGTHLILTGQLTAGSMMSFVTLTQVFMRIGSGESTFGQSWPQLLTAGAMLASMLIWPIVMRVYNKKMKKRKREELIFKYDEYLKRREKEIEEEVHLQRDILIENLITVNDCLEIIGKRNIGFWDNLPLLSTFYHLYSHFPTQLFPVKTITPIYIIPFSKF